MNIIDNFLKTEIMYADMYNEILYFINSAEIRRGEFEANEFIISKLDHNNFIIYREDVYKNGNVDISCAVAVNKSRLAQRIEEYAKSIGIVR